MDAELLGRLYCEAKARAIYKHSKIFLIYFCALPFFFNLNTCVWNAKFGQQPNYFTISAYPPFDDPPKLWKTLGAKLGKGLSKFWTSYIRKRADPSFGP